MLLFWERGFEGTSMADLNQAMGLNPSSIYAAFGDKHALFSLAVKRYIWTVGRNTQRRRWRNRLSKRLSVQAANGSTKAELKRTSQMALRHLGY